MAEVRICLSCETVVDPTRVTVDLSQAQSQRAKDLAAREAVKHCNFWVLLSIASASAKTKRLYFMVVR